MTPPVALSRRARSGLAVSTALSACIFGWAAMVLPWRPATPLALLTFGLALLHAATALGAVYWPHQVSRIWRLLAFSSLAAGLTFVGAIVATSIQVVRMYGDLGWGLAALLGAIGVLLLVGTLPMGIIGLRATRAAHERS